MTGTVYIKREYLTLSDRRENIERLRRKGKAAHADELEAETVALTAGGYFDEAGSPYKERAENYCKVCVNGFALQHLYIMLMGGATKTPETESARQLLEKLIRRQDAAEGLPSIGVVAGGKKSGSIRATLPANDPHV